MEKIDIHFAQTLDRNQYRLALRGLSQSQRLLSNVDVAADLRDRVFTKCVTQLYRIPKTAPAGVEPATFRSTSKQHTADPRLLQEPEDKPLISETWNRRA